ncbi:MAG: hypothetical protein GWP19_12375 [Planctomycetia bacterium]|nr:hypothetical protein [Planctomycetia bacterium]
MKYLLEHITKYAFCLILINSVIFPQDVGVKVNIKKSIFLTGEPIFVEIEFSNLSSDTFYLHPAEWSIHLIDEAENRIPRTYFIDWGPSKWKPTFEPGDQIEFFKELTDLFGKKVNSSLKPVLPVLPVGNYYLYIEGKTKTRYDILKKIQKVTNFKSNEIELEIKDPIGVEKKVYDLLRLAYDNEYSKRQLNEAEEIYQRIIDNYPQSLYLSRASYFFALMYRFSKQEPQKILSYKRYKKLMQKHPDSYFSIWGLQNAQQLNSILYGEDKSLLLEEIINLYPDTKVSKKAVKLLKSLDSENNVRK